MTRKKLIREYNSIDHMALINSYKEPSLNLYVSLYTNSMKAKSSPVLLRAFRTFAFNWDIYRAKHKTDGNARKLYCRPKPKSVARFSNNSVILMGNICKVCYIMIKGWLNLYQ